MDFASSLALSRNTLDRLAERRADEQWLSTAWNDAATRVVLVAQGRVAVSDDRGSLAPIAAADAPVGERYLLGCDVTGRVWFAVRPAATEDTAELSLADGSIVATASLREVGAVLDDTHAGLAVHAVALANWHEAHPRCPRCGEPTEVSAAGAQRSCRNDGSSHFPRSDPAMIVVVTDPADRALLGRQHGWPPGRFSALAGFVEPGESAERAVRREVAEEAGVVVDDVTYLGSQPWPFPASLMLGFAANVKQHQVSTPDGQELAETMWFSRNDVAALIKAGDLVIPPSISIARRLIEHWYGKTLPQGPAGSAWRPNS